MILILIEIENLNKDVPRVGKPVLGFGKAVLKDCFSIATLLPLIGDLSKNAAYYDDQLDERKVLVILI